MLIALTFFQSKWTKEFYDLPGWGATQSSETNAIIHGAEIPVLNQQVCANTYRRAGTITPRMMCAGLLEGGKDSCQG